MHTRYINTVLLYIIAMGLSSTDTYADPANLNLTGNVVASPCVLVNSDIIIELGSDIQSKDLAVEGSATEWKPFTVELVNCPAATSTATVTFNGVVAPLNPNMYSNSGTATNVAIDLQTSAGIPLGNLSTLTQSVETDRSVDYELRARIYAVANNVLPGTVNSIVDMTLTYQ